MNCTFTSSEWPAFHSPALVSTRKGISKILLLGKQLSVHQVLSTNIYVQQFHLQCGWNAPAVRWLVFELCNSFLKETNWNNSRSTNIFMFKLTLKPTVCARYSPSKILSTTTSRDSTNRYFRRVLRFQKKNKKTNHHFIENVMYKNQ
jgi:hypothetical protein